MFSDEKMEQIKERATELGKDPEEAFGEWLKEIAGSSPTPLFEEGGGYLLEKKEK